MTDAGQAQEQINACNLMQPGGGGDGGGPTAGTASDSHPLYQSSSSDPTTSDTVSRNLCKSWAAGCVACRQANLSCTASRERIKMTGSVLQRTYVERKSVKSYFLQIAKKKKTVELIPDSTRFDSATGVHACMQMHGHA